MFFDKKAIKHVSAKRFRNKFDPFREKPLWTYKEFVEKEIEVMKAFDHDNLLPLTEVIIDEKEDFHLVMPFCSKGTILSSKYRYFAINSAFASYAKNIYSENEIRFLFKDILTGVKSIDLNSSPRRKLRSP